MKSFHKDKGWMFTLVGGPHAGMKVRSPWDNKAYVKGTKAPEQAARLHGLLQTQVPTISFADGAVYELQAHHDAHGTRVMAPGAPKTEVPAYRYVYQDARSGE